MYFFSLEYQVSVPAHLALQSPLWFCHLPGCSATQLVAALQFQAKGCQRCQPTEASGPKASRVWQVVALHIGQPRLIQSSMSRRESSRSLNRSLKERDGI